MGRHSIFAEPVKTIKTVCINGVYIIDKRISYNRRQKMHKCQKNMTEGSITGLKMLIDTISLLILLS
jgi:hypothetical protein